MDSQVNALLKRGRLVSIEEHVLNQASSELRVRTLQSFVEAAKSERYESPQSTGTVLRYLTSAAQAAQLGIHRIETALTGEFEQLNAHVRVEDFGNCAALTRNINGRLFCLALFERSSIAPQQFEKTIKLLTRAKAETSKGAYEARMISDISVGLESIEWLFRLAYELPQRKVLAAVQEALRDPKWDFRTIPSVARQLRLTEPEVQNILAGNTDIFRKSPLKENGRELFALRSRGIGWRERLAWIQHTLQSTSTFR